MAEAAAHVDALIKALAEDHVMHSTTRHAIAAVVAWLNNQRRAGDFVRATEKQ